MIDHLSLDLIAARPMLSGLIATPRPDKNALDKFLDGCPYVNEPLEGQEEAAVTPAWRQYREGRVVSHREVVGSRDGHDDR